jgi:predicted enzyme involved in methoxymalonyl-ACP biosynthesis
LSCQDKFGDYGLVGFVNVNVNTAQPSPLVEDFVISCRIAQKHVEEAFFHWLSKQDSIKQHPTLRARLTKTGRNTPLQLVLQELKFQAIEEAGNNALLEVDVARLGNINPTATVSL